MPQNCKSVAVEDVIHFFEVEINGMGKHDGHPRNEGVPGTIRAHTKWELCDLARDEFESLVLPYREGVILKDRGPIDDLVQWAKDYVEESVRKLKSGDSLPSLIIIEPMPGGPEGGTFHIVDGAKRALAYRKYFRDNSYVPVRAYVGSGRV